MKKLNSLTRLARSTSAEITLSCLEENKFDLTLQIIISSVMEFLLVWVLKQSMARASLNKSGYVHCKFFLYNKYLQGIPALHRVLRNMHINFMGMIGMQPEIPAKIVGKFEKNTIKSSYQTSTQSIYFANYRDYGQHAIPVNLKSPQTDFPINPCKHLQCTLML